MPNPISGPGVYNFNFQQTHYDDPEACAMNFCGATVPVKSYADLGARVTAGFIDPGYLSNNLLVTDCEMGIQGTRSQYFDPAPYYNIDMTSPREWNA